MGRRVKPADDSRICWSAWSTAGRVVWLWKQFNLGASRSKVVIQSTGNPAMAAPSSAYPLPTLALGHGPLEFEVFVEPTCPHSKRAFEKFRPLLAAIGEDRLTIKIRFVSQPWHLFSGVVTRSILAASATAGGVPAAFRAMEGIYEHRENFEFEKHSSGPNMNRTPADIIREVGQHAGIDVAQAFRLDSVDRAMRWHARYYRQNGVHSSPTFMVGGLVEPAMSSGQTIEEWTEFLRPHLGL